MVSMAELSDGMRVRTSDGHDLGKIIRLDAGILVIEKGFFFPKDYEVPISLVSEIRDGEACLSVSKEALEHGGAGADTAMAGRTTGSETSGSWTGERREGWTGAQATGDSGYRAGGTTEETRVQLAEEELEATKRMREAGEVRVRKEVVTEHKTIEVPVTREEVHVERVPVSASDATVGRDAFDEKTVVVPVHEEEVEIRKRPRVREEVRVSKTSRTVEQRADAEVRREEARIERTDGNEDRGSIASRSDDETDRGGLVGRGTDDGRGGLLAGSDDANTTGTAGYGSTTSAGGNGGGILGLGRDDDDPLRRG